MNRSLDLSRNFTRECHPKDDKTLTVYDKRTVGGSPLSLRLRTVIVLGLYSQPHRGAAYVSLNQIDHQYSGLELPPCYLVGFLIKGIEGGRCDARRGDRQGEVGRTIIERKINKRITIKMCHWSLHLQPNPITIAGLVI